MEGLVEEENLTYEKTTHVAILEVVQCRGVAEGKSSPKPSSGAILGVQRFEDAREDGIPATRLFGCDCRN